MQVIHHAIPHRPTSIIYSAVSHWNSKEREVVISPHPLIIEELINKNDLQESYFAGSPLVAYSQTVSLRERLNPSSSRKPKVQANPAWIKEEPLSIFSGDC